MMRLAFALLWGIAVVLTVSLVSCRPSADEIEEEEITAAVEENEIGNENDAEPTQVVEEATDVVTEVPTEVVIEINEEPEDVLLEEISALANRDNVTARINGANQRLPSPNTVDLDQEDGVSVDDAGRAILNFSDIMLVEVMREGELQVREFSLTGNSAVIDIFQSGGTFFNDLETELDVALTVEGDFAMVTATGTRFMIVRELGTELEWVVAMDVSDGDMSVMADGVEKPLTTGNARWIAPIGEPSPAFGANMANVNGWLENVRNGRGGSVAEIGELIWQQGDDSFDTSTVPVPLPVGQFFALSDVQIFLVEEQGRRYGLNDCNGDGIDDIVLANGLMLLDLRQVLSRLRSLDATIANFSRPRSVSFAGYSPAGFEDRIGEIQRASDSDGAVEVLSLRSEEEPYHFASLEMVEGCFLGLSLTPPDLNGRPGEARPVPADALGGAPLPAPSPTSPVGDIGCGRSSEPISIKFEWSPVGNPNTVDRYELEIAYHGLDRNIGGFTTDSRPTLDVLVSCDAGDSEWRVRALGVDGTEGDWSEAAGFTVCCGQPLQAPDPVQPKQGQTHYCIASEGSFAPLFDWTSVDYPAGIDRYEVDISLESGPSGLLEVSGDQSETSIKVPCQRDVVAWKVRAIGGDGAEGPWSQESLFSLVNVRYLFSVVDAGPELIEAWEVSDDGTVWTLFINQDYLIDNGEPFNSAEVVQLLEQYGDMFNPGISAVFEADDYTLIIEFAGPNFDFNSQATGIEITNVP
jgi:hypothetical protein